MRVLRRLLRILVVLVVGLALLAGLAIGGLVTWVSTRALPQTAGRLQVPGLAAEVTVRRDAAGIPQIYARTPDDLFFAQGYVQASERFWQMEVFRHASAGRLSELFGSSQLDRDRLIRTLGFRQAGQRDFDNASPDTKRALQRYADGVNAWLGQNRGRLGMPFVLIGLTAGLGGGIGGYSPAPWTPVDSTSFAKLQAFVLGGNLDTEVLRTEVTSWLGGRPDANAIMATLFPPYPSDGPVVTTASGVTSAIPAGRRPPRARRPRARRSRNSRRPPRRRPHRSPGRLLRACRPPPKRRPQRPRRLRLPRPPSRPWPGLPTSPTRSAPRSGWGRRAATRAWVRTIGSWRPPSPRPGPRSSPTIRTCPSRCPASGS